MNAVIKIPSNVGHTLQIYIYFKWLAYRFPNNVSQIIQFQNATHKTCVFAVLALAPQHHHGRGKKQQPKTDHDLIDFDKSVAERRREYQRLTESGRCVIKQKRKQTEFSTRVISRVS